MAVFCVTPVLRTGYVVMVEGLTCLHGCVQYGCCVVVVNLSWPWMSVGRLRDTALVRCGLCVNGGGVLADVCYTEKASPTRHRPEHQHNARSNRRKQCSPNETKPYSKLADVCGASDVWCTSL